ncbi:MAG: putative baseplate assembly protein [Steroidobacteraceae bacterium]
MNRTGICKCCDGIDAETPETISNRPGLSRIAYRVGNWQEFKATMLDALSNQPALMALKTRSDDDFTIALLDSFAVVCDILTFYSERSANEHYLGTAAHLVSLRELAKLVGYKPAPGVAANAALAITIQSPPPALPGPPGQIPSSQLVPSIVPVPVGLQAQSIPDPGEQPVTFETVAAIEARWNWNALIPRLTRPLSTDASNAQPSYLRLKGLVGSLAVGDWLLVIVNDAAAATSTPGVNRVASVTLENAAKTTLVIFDGTVAGTAAILTTDPSATAPPLTGTLGDAAIQASIKGYVWADQTQLVAAAGKLQWPLQQLEDNINALNAAGSTASPPAVQIFKLGVRAALFGHNAPLYTALPTYTPLGAGGIASALPDWDTTPATIAIDPKGNTGWMSLDQTYASLVQGSWVVVQGPGTAQPLVLQISQSRTLSRTGFMLSGKVTQLAFTNPPAALGSMTIRTTTVLGTTDELVVAEQPVTTPISGASIALGSAQLGLQPGQQVVITGSALDQSERTSSEVRSIAGLSLVDGYTHLALDADLTHTYDASSVTINANVAPATHGETKSEILGSGTGTASYQKFYLKQPPLTYVSAATPSGVASTLEVRVNGALWDEVPWLAGEAPTERVFTTSMDEQGNTVVQFGDGAENGARLPTGQNNVTAKYRQGIGSAGNVRAGQITTLLTRPMGLQSVINPVAASGGGDPESIDSARRNVPVTTRALDRIVSLEDVGDFARASAAVAKSEAVWAWDGSRRVACATVAGAGGAAIDTGTDQFNDLIKAMRAASDGSFRIVLCNYVPRTFIVGATLIVDSTLDADAVVASAKDALRSAFGFDARDFMQPVYRSEVFAVLQAVPGVIALTVDSFQYSDQPGLQTEQLVAEPPTLLGGALVGAQLLTLDSGLLPAVVHS